MKILEIAEINVGRNVTRIVKEDLKKSTFYTFDDLNYDLTHVTDEYSQQDRKSRSTHVTTSGDIIFSFVGTKAAVVTEENSGKLLNQNFAKIVVDATCMDPYYFCYVVNESIGVQRQKYSVMQGSIIPKMTPAILKEITVDLPQLKKQTSIGRAYFNLCKRQYLLQRQADLEEQFFMNIIRQSDPKNN